MPSRPEEQPLTPEACDALFAPMREADGLLLAVSGGPDSMALMRLAAAWRARAGGPPLAVATIDHGLRPGSREEAEYVGSVAAGLGLAHAILLWEGRKPASRLQERAREARYALLTAHARTIGASHLVTGHTLDDQAETILFRMARGSGIAGLAGMRARVERGGIVHLRPFLCVGKSQLVATCQAHSWKFFEDPSNRDPRFARARWRRLLAELAEEGLTAARLALLAQRLARADAALDRMAEKAAAAARLGEDAGSRTHVYDGRLLLAEPEEIVIRVLARALGQDRTGQLRLDRLETLSRELLAAVSRGVPLKRTLAGALVCAQSDGSIRIGPEPHRRRGVGRTREGGAGERAAAEAVGAGSLSWQRA